MASAPPSSTTSRPIPVAVVALLSVATFVTMTYETLPVGLIQVMARGLSVSLDDIGMLVTVYGAVVAIGAIPLSALVARWPHERAFPIVLSVFAASSVIGGLATNLTVAIVARLVGGAAHAVFFSVAFAAMVARTAPGRRGRAATALGTGNALALVLGIPAATALGTSTSWRVPFFTTTVCFVVLAVLGRVVIGRRAPVHHTAVTSARQVLRAAMSRPLLKVAVAVILTMTAHFATYTYVSPILTSAGIWESAVPMVLLAYGVMGALSLCGTAVVADRAPSTGLRVTVAVTAACLLGLWFAQTSALGTVASVAVWGLAFGAAPALWQIVALRAAPHEPGAGPAVINASFNVGIAFGAWSGGTVVAQHGVGALVLGSAAVAFLALAVVVVPRWLPGDRAQPTRTHERTQERARAMVDTT